MQRCYRSVSHSDGTDGFKGNWVVIVGNYGFPLSFAAAGLIEMFLPLYLFQRDHAGEPKT